MDWSRIGTAPGEEQQEAEGTAEEGAGKGAVGAGKGCTVTTADLWGKEVPSLSLPTHLLQLPPIG